jgi:hypothetical protein
MNTTPDWGLFNTGLYRPVAGIVATPNTRQFTAVTGEIRVTDEKMVKITKNNDAPLKNSPVGIFYASALKSATVTGWC